MANGGYAIIDLGLTEEEFLTAMSTKLYDGTKEQYDIIVNAIKSGKPLVVVVPFMNETVNLIATPIMTKGDTGEFVNVGFLTQPGIFGGLPMSIGLITNPNDYNMQIGVYTLNAD